MVRMQHLEGSSHQSSCPAQPCPTYSWDDRSEDSTPPPERYLGRLPMAFAMSRAPVLGWTNRTATLVLGQYDVMWLKFLSRDSANMFNFSHIFLDLIILILLFLSFCHLPCHLAWSDSTEARTAWTLDSTVIVCRKTSTAFPSWMILRVYVSMLDMLLEGR